ncbi:MAG TPA: hypothetical protein VGG29_20725 [Caulobacteraceae bacterium]
MARRKRPRPPSVTQIEITAPVRAFVAHMVPPDVRIVSLGFTGPYELTVGYINSAGEHVLCKWIAVEDRIMD